MRHPLQLRIIQPKMSFVPKLRNPELQIFPFQNIKINKIKFKKPNFNSSKQSCMSLMIVLNSIPTLNKRFTKS